ncbi:peptide deformylase [bacterium]|nr:peptide deformylase [bacterium]MBU1652309.1 peptide deformylase [bacterium]
MTAEEILIFGNPTLRKNAAPLTVFDDSLKATVEEMFTTMIEADGIGLAAPQVGISKRFLIIGMPREDDEIERLFFANPEVVAMEGESEYDEGCLSVPGIRAEILRPEWIRFRYQDIDGNQLELEDGGLLARVLQHEIDHLNGILFIDRLSPSKRSLLKKTLQKMAETGQKPDNIPAAFSDAEE